jgi:gluconokinase
MSSPGSTTSPGSAGKTVIVVMGVAGSGKTTVAVQLAERLGWTFAEADDFHPPANVAKMASGIPLTDDDRWPWLAEIAGWIQTAPGDAVITCSALRRSYREVLGAGPARVRYVHLNGTVELLTRRLSSRIGHFMPASMLESQLATLEPLGPDEDGAVINIDAAPDDIVEDILTTMRLA